MVRGSSDTASAFLYEHIDYIGNGLSSFMQSNMVSLLPFSSFQTRTLKAMPKRITQIKAFASISLLILLPRVCLITAIYIALATPCLALPCLALPSPAPPRLA